MIRHILFDLDGTLYSLKEGLQEFFSRRLREYASSWLEISWEECEPLWKDAMKRHGTTLEWLINDYGYTDTEAFFAYVHPENEAEFLPYDPQLRGFLEKLPLPCSILTNSPGFHAERIIKKLDLEGIFQKVFAIDPSGLGGKPHPSSYKRALDAFELKPEEMLFIDDVPRYVEGYLKTGGRALLLDETDTHRDYPHERIKNLKEITRFLE